MEVVRLLFLLTILSSWLSTTDAFSYPKQHKEVDRISHHSASCSCWERTTKTFEFPSAQRRRRPPPILLRSTLSPVNGDDTEGGTIVSKLDALISKEMQQKKQTVRACLRKNDYRGAWKGIKSMMKSLQALRQQQQQQQQAATTKNGAIDLSNVSETVDQALQEFYNHAFSTPYQGGHAVHRVSLGLEALQLQLSSETLEAPYNTVPKRYCLAALKALTRVNELKHATKTGSKFRRRDLRSSSSASQELDRTDAAYRLLQRLVTGVGIRHFNPQRKTIHESDFNTVLNAYSNVGRMDMAHRIVALQERTPHAPPISPVAYSILLKGYGKLRDLGNIEMLLDHARESQVEPDTVMLNSLMDAYVNCNSLDKAMNLFQLMKSPTSATATATTINATTGSEHLFLFSDPSCARPNRRTYNTILKGLGSVGALEDALELSQEMEEKLLWDAVTTNTLVQAAVLHGDFDLAETILDKHTELIPNNTLSRHPNVEAYTNLLDGFAKSGNLPKALHTLLQMEKRGVEPNEVTYSCIIGALAREKKTEQAKKMLSYMQANGLRPSVVTYNSFISGLVGKERTLVDTGFNVSFDNHVDDAILILREMLKQGVRPNPVTVSVLVGAFGKCERPRVAEAKALIAKLETDRIVTANNTRIATALIQVCGIGEDFTGACEAFRRVRKPDVAAVNAFLDACSRCNMDSELIQTFQRYFQSENHRLEPDVISHSIVISCLLNKNTILRSRQARTLYEEMKDRRRIMPDHVLVDIILKALVSKGRKVGLGKAEELFLTRVVRDARSLDWTEGQLERRTLAVQSVITSYTNDIWGKDADRYGWLSAEETEDELFKKHGWNRVDSGFHLWGSGNRKRVDSRTKSDDEFLQSKGWNNVDSGFRIF